MQVEYKKEWMDTYLWVLPDKQAEDNYVEQMLRYNPGEGRLDFSKQEKDGVEFFCYKITGKKSLNSIYAVMPIGERQIREILTQLFAALEGGKEYLLTEEDFVLSPNYIFATFPQMKLEFCYVPGYGVSLREQLEGLFEYLLNRVDYDDKQAVGLLYDCYMFCTKESGGLTEIKKLLGKNEENLQEMKIQVEEIKRTLEIDQKPEVKQRSEIKQKQEVKQDLGIKPLGAGDKEETKQTIKKEPSYVTWLTDRLFHRGRKEVALVAEESAGYYAGPKGKRPLPKTGDKGLLKQENGTAQEKRLAQQKQTVPERGEESEQTMLLSVVHKSAELELVSEKTGEVIPVTKFPFYLGSAGEYVDYVLVGEGVSRIHCCVNKKMENYYLSDLNSTNGTFLNNKEVLPGKNELLSANDEIRIVSHNFYLKFPCH